MSVYEVHLGSWRRKSDGSSLSYLELADELPPYLKEHGFTHLEFLPLAEHPLGASWGYQVTGYFAPTSRFGPPGDFKRLVDALHTAGIGVIMDWVPAHFPRDEFALANFDGWPTYEYADPRMGEHQDWGTLVFDYARPEVRSFLMSSAVSWLDRYHVDGLRVDAVASMLYLDYSRKEGEWLPNRRGGRENLEAITLLKQTNEEVHRLHPGTVMIAEESTAFPKVTGKVSDGGLGFDFKWNMGWMHDVLEYFNASPTDRLALSSKLTFGCTYQFSENYVHVFSHDEVVHGKSPMIFKMSAGEEGVSGHAAQLRSFYAYTWAWPGKKTLFMGSEFGQTTEWNCDSSLDWDLLQHTDHAGLARLIRDLNNLYRSHAFLGAGDHLSDKFRWIECGEGAPAIFSFFRFGDSPEDTLLVACNFSDEPAQGHRVGVPVEGCWRMILHSRDELYGGSLKDFDREIFSENVSADEWENSLMMDLQAHATIFFMPASE
jgi:1,4-alpha-glucan branching enzyme